MRIVMTSHSYAPNVGGIETVSQLVAQGLRARGHDVLVLTETGAATRSAEAGVLRRPSLRAAWRAVRDADVVLQSNIGLRRLWLPLLLRKPVVVVSHTWLRRPDGSMGWQDHLKRWLLKHVQVTAAVSHALARHVGPNCRVLPNPYDSELFNAGQQPAERYGGAGRQGLLFLGRLVSDKGCDQAIAALATLRAERLDVGLTVIGAGPEASRLHQQAAELNVAQHVHFKGMLRGADLAREMQRHRVLLACSRWEEPFGLVALEALATGLVPVVPKHGGLPEAVGPFGCTYEPGHLSGLVTAAKRALAQASLATPARGEEALERHLASHQQRNVVAAYEAVLVEATAGHG